MPDLIAQGEQPESRWRRGLPELASGRDILLGREPRKSPPDSQTKFGESAIVNAVGDDQPQLRHVAAIPWAVPWDATISRHHALLSVIDGDRLRVTKDPRGRNPIFYRGQPRQSFVIVPGEHFVIGGTTFTLARRPGFTGGGDVFDGASKASDSLTPDWVRRSDESVGKPTGDDTSRMDPDAGSQLRNEAVEFPRSQVDGVTEMAFASSSLRQRRFRDTRTRIDLLSRLPDLVAGSLGDDELFARVTDVLLRATPSASAVAIVKANAESANSAMQILHYDARNHETNTRDVSTKLVTATLKRRDSVLHLWDATEKRSGSVEYTAAANVDWAFAVPLRSDACRGWVLYVTGSRAGLIDPANPSSQTNDSRAIIDQLSDDVKFAEVVGSLISGIRQTGLFQQRHAAMRRFFAPVVLDAIAGKDSEAWLKPRECDLSVMFCDLRGFSRTSEDHSEKLLDLLGQVSSALGVMTRHILETEGVIGDFHGDAAMGFWGWPLPLSGPIEPKIAATLAAAKAASEIRRDYARDESVFRCGIGIASGPAVAGRIGTVDQVKVTAFGPVVNLASRLEGLTKTFGVEILVDEETANRLKAAPDEYTLRYLGLVRVAGTTNAVHVYQLVMPIPGQPVLTDDQLKLSRSAWDAFVAGDWAGAYELLHQLPAWDRPKDVLLQKILSHHRIAPPGWDGVMTFEK